MTYQLTDVFAEDPPLDSSQEDQLATAVGKPQSFTKWSRDNRKVSASRLTQSQPSAGASILSNRCTGLEVPHFVSAVYVDDYGTITRLDLKEIRLPSLTTYSNLKRLLERCSPQGMQSFLECNGLHLLLDGLRRLAAKRSHSLVDVILQLNCVKCIKTVMDSQTGLTLIIENNDYIQKLATGE